MKIKLEVKTPHLINFVRVLPGDSKGEGICVPIEELDDEEWEEFQETWMQELDNYRRARMEQKEPTQ